MENGCSPPRLRPVVVGCLACVLLPYPVIAQERDGAVEGVVTAADGTPVAGATARLLEAGMVAATGPDGHYRLTRVPAGAYTVRIQAPEFRPAEARAVRVWSGQTITLDARLDRRPADPEASMTTAELEASPFPVFVESSWWAVSGDVVDALPADDIRDVAVLQPGVVETGISSEPLLRGSEAGAAVLFVDGVPVRSARTGGQAIMVGTNAVEELAVVTGGLGTAFGDARGGALSVVTRAGTAPFGASASYETDGPFGDGVSVGFHRFEGRVSKGLAPGLSATVGGTLQGEGADRRGKGADDVLAFLPGDLDTTVTRGGEVVAIPEFVQANGRCDAADNFGSGCRGRRFPLDWHTRATLDATIQWLYRTDSRVAITVLLDRDQDRIWPGALSFDPDAYSGTRSSGGVYLLRWSHDFRAEPERELAFDVTLSRQRNTIVSGPFDPSWEADHRNPFAGMVLSPMDFLVDFERFSDDTGPDAVISLDGDGDWEQLVRNVLTATGTRVPYLNRFEFQAVQPFRMNPWAISSGMPTQGADAVGPNVVLARERRWVGRAQLVWRPDARHRLTLGGEFQSSRVQSFRGRLTRLVDLEVFDESPTRLAAYVQDRIALGAATVEFGLRWDRFSTGALYPVVPGRIGSNPAFDPATFMDPAAGILREAQAHDAVSPRMRMAFRPSDRTGLRVGFAQQVQSPDLASAIAGKNHDLSFVLSSTAFGGDVGLANTLQVEAGVRHAFTPSLIIDVAGFAKPKIETWAYRLQRFLDPNAADSIDVNVLTTIDQGRTFGFELGAIASAADWLHGQLAYTFEDVGQRAPLAFGGTERRPAGFQRTHTVAGWFAVEAPRDLAPRRWYGAVLRNAGAYGQFRFASGLPYTRLRSVGSGVVAPGPTSGLFQAVEPFNASRLPWFSEFDLRVTKAFHLGGATLTAYADARNLLDFTNTIAVFAETGETTNDLHREEVVNPELARLEQDAGTRLIEITKDGAPISAVDLRGDCTDWGGTGGVVDCVLLRRAEARWGDGDEIYDLNEQLTAFNAAYELFNGGYRLRGAPRHVRLGIEVGF